MFLERKLMCHLTVSAADKSECCLLHFVSKNPDISVWKVPLPLVGSGLASNMFFLGPPVSVPFHYPNGTSINSALFHRSHQCVENTERKTTVTVGWQHVASAVIIGYIR